MDPMAQVITLVLGALAVFGAFAAWLVRHMDRRFDEARAEMDRRFGEVDARFDEAKVETDRRFDEAKAETDRRFDEARADRQRGFDGVREDHLRLETKLDSQAARIADLRQDVGRLQGIVERTYEPARFTVPSARETRAGDEVRDARAGYDVASDSEDPERTDEP